MYQLGMNEPRFFDGATRVTSEDCDALFISPSNNQIQKTGAGLVGRDNETFPASDLERSKDRGFAQRNPSKLLPCRSHVATLGRW